MSAPPISAKETTWVDRAEAALADRTPGDEEVRVLRGRRPPLLDAEGIQAVLAPMMAAVVWAAAVFREMVAGTSVDPLALGLRLLALGLTLRVLLLGATMARRLRIHLSHAGWGLALTPEGLLLRSPELDLAVPKESVIGVVERGRWQERSGGRRWSEVYVVIDPRLGRTHLVLPPVFEETAGLLAERLMRWRGPMPEPVAPTAAPAALASKLYDDAVANRAPEGVTVVRHGREWIQKGPYLLVLVAIAAIDSIARGGPRVWEAIDPLVGAGLVLAVLVIPARWLWMTRREVTPRRGVSMVLTPAECLIGTREGMLRTRWKDLAKVSVDSKKKWSVLEAAHHERQLVFTRLHAPPIRYDEPFLGMPVEAAQILVDAYRRGALPTMAGADYRSSAGSSAEPERAPDEEE